MKSPTVYYIGGIVVLVIWLIWVYAGPLSGKKKELEQARQDNADLTTQIETLQQQRSQIEQKLTVELVERIHFESGSARLTDESRKKIQDVLGKLRGEQNKRIRIVGHTDDQTIIPDFPRIYASNWELSVHRATSVARFLEEQGIEPSRLEPTGMSKYHPATSNDTAQGRAQNRRVEIYLVPVR